MKTNILLLLCFLSCHLAEPQAQQPGLDPSFGDNGIVMTPFHKSNNGQIYDMAIQPDSKILVSGGNKGGIVIRYQPDGGLDKTFADAGVFIFPSKSGFKPVLSTLYLNQDGKILVGGYYRPPHTSQLEKFLLIRLLPDGNLDPEFATGGVDTSALYKQCSPSAMALQKDGKILLGGHYSGKIALARYMPEGGLDSSFGNDGMALIDNGPLGGVVSGIAILPDERILLGGDGYMEYAAGGYRDAFMLTRLLPDGSLDTTFNHSGQVYHRICNCYNYGLAMKRLSNGKILMAGYSNGGNLLRLNEDGSLDTSFNHTGIAIVDSAEIRSNIVVGPDEKIWMGGTRNTDFAVYRFLKDGKLDSAFGENGKITTKIQRKDNRIYAMALQADGKIVAGGYSRDTFTTPNIITMTRYLPDGKTAIAIPQTAKDDINLYPNPTNAYLRIDNNSGKTIQKVTMYAMDGRKVNELTLRNGNRIPIRHLPQGVYTVHLYMGDRKVKKKVTIVQ